MIARAGAGLVLLWLVSLPVLTALRVPIWQDELALWRDAVDQAPAKPRPWVNYGRMLHLTGDIDSAERAYRSAIHAAQSPDRPAREQAMGWAVGTTNLAIVLAHRGEQANAIGLLRDVLAKYPRYVEAEHVLRDIGGEP